MPHFTSSDFRRAMRNGAYAWPGGYPLYFICADGKALSFASAKANRRLILSATHNRDDAQWRVVGVEINWENDSLYCADTGAKIESAYGESE